MRARRLPGEGSIYKRADGRWTGSVEVPGNSRRRRYVYGRTKSEVAAKLRETRRAGPLPSTRTPTWSEWSVYYVQVVAVRKVAPRTLSGYASMLRLHVDPVLGRLRLDRIRADHVEAVLGRCSTAGLSGTSSLHVYRCMSHALKVAAQRGHLTVNPCSLVDAPAATTGEAVPLTTAEARNVLATACGGRNAARWSVALALGLRQSEALGLRWSDVDFDAGTLRVSRQLARGTHELIEPKSSSGRRVVSLPGTLLAELRGQRMAYVAERLAAGSVWQERDFVFPRPDGLPTSHRADRSAWARLLEDAGVPHRPLHAARHTAATLLLLQGVDVRVVQGVLGHASSTLTRDTYQHLVPELAAAAADRMEAALWPAAVNVAVNGPRPSLGPR